MVARVRSHLWHTEWPEDTWGGSKEGLAGGGPRGVGGITRTDLELEVRVG